MVETPTTLEDMLNLFLSEPQSVFSAPDFMGIAPRKEVAGFLKTKLKQGVIEALNSSSKETFYHPVAYSETLETRISVSPESFAQAYARVNHIGLHHTQNVALNLLGLSTQVPAKFEYNVRESHASVCYQTSTGDWDSAIAIRFFKCFSAWETDLYFPFDDMAQAFKFYHENNLPVGEKEFATIERSLSRIIFEGQSLEDVLHQFVTDTAFCPSWLNDIAHQLHDWHKQKALIAKG